MCTVVIDGKTVQSCQYPAKNAQNTEIFTIERVGTSQNLHPLQKAFIDYGAVQCGYCEPAFIMAAYALLNQNSKPSHNDIMTTITPILCRCTGHVQIIEAIEAMAKGEYQE